MPLEFKAALHRCNTDGIPLHDALLEHVGADHAVVGAMLLEKWRFAPELVETTRYQLARDLRDTEMIACVFAANQISKKLRFGFGGNPFYDELPETVQRRLGATLDELISSLGDLNPIFEESKVFAKL